MKKINHRHPLARRFFVRMYPDYKYGSVSKNRHTKMINKATDAANECLEMLKFFHVFLVTRHERVFDDYLLDEFFDMALFTMKSHLMERLRETTNP